MCDEYHQQECGSTHPREGSAGSMADAALEYAERGWKVFPVFEPSDDGSCSCGHAECDRPGKHPRVGGGHTKATTDPDQIRKWWRRWPKANIGIATGRASGLWVLDIDSRENGTSLADLEAEYGPLSSVPSVASGGGGLHLYFRYPDVDVSCSVGVLPGVDVRGDGGYIIAPPSIHASQGSYQWRAA